MIRYKDGKVDRSWFNWSCGPDMSRTADELADALDSANAALAVKEAEIVRLRDLCKLMLTLYD